MNPKVYVGNVSFLATEGDLQLLFSQAGRVAWIAFVRDRQTGRSRGFALVEMSSPAEAQEAIRMFNGFTLGDRKLRVNMVQSREERSRDLPRGSASPGRPPQLTGSRRDEEKTSPVVHLRRTGTIR